jgi:hypothetical protein
MSDGPFFSHEPRRPSGSLSSATRFLCAAAYLHHTFAKLVIWHLLATRDAIAPSVNFDVGPVLRHCLRARRNILIRDIVLVVILLAGLIIRFPATLDFILFAVSLGYLMPNIRKRRSGLLSTIMFAIATAAGVGLAVTLAFTLVVGTFATSALTSGSLSSGVAGLIGLGVSFLLLLVVTWATEFAYLRITFRTLAQDLRKDGELPRAMSAAAEERIATIEGAQRGNITLHSGWFPFIGAGEQTETHWSIAIRLRPKDPMRQRLRDQGLDADDLFNDAAVPADEYVQIDPVDLHKRIRERLVAMKDAALPTHERISALTVSDRLVGSGLLSVDNPLFDPVLKTPYSHASRSAMEELIRHPQASLRYYQQVSVSDRGPAVLSGTHRVIDGIDQDVEVSAFVHAAAEGRMLYLQFVLTALPPIDAQYQIIGFRHVSSLTGSLTYAIRRLFGSIASAPNGIYAAVRLWHTERQMLWRTEQQMEKEQRELARAQLSAVVDFGSKISVRQIATAPWFHSYIQELDVEKYNLMISRLLLETVQDYLDEKGVDTSAFESSAQNIINNGDVISISGNSGTIGNVGSRRNTRNSSTASGSGSNAKTR